MSKTARTWTILILTLVIIILILWLLRRKSSMMTNTSVKIGGDVSHFPTRNETNERLLRICTYDSGEQLSLDPNAVGGHCPPVYTDIAGKTGNLVKDEIIALPQAGTFTGTPGGGLE